MIVIRDAMKRFPGRRGKAEITNFHYHSLSFSEVVLLKNILKKDEVEFLKQTPYEQLAGNTIIEEKIEDLYGELRRYAVTGGFLTAINDLAKEGKIFTQTLVTYWEWILGDTLKHERSEKYLREILAGIIRRYNTQITWNSLSKEMSIDHHKTVSDYCEMLAEMDAVFVQQALLEHKLAGAPKKARKLYFNDPFIYHAVYSVLNDIGDPWKNYLEKLLITGDEEFIAPHIEAMVVTHFSRRFKTFYIKEPNEIDVAYLDGRKICPVEVKWTNRLREKELSGISKYPNGIIASKTREIFKTENNLVAPVPIVLIKSV